MKQFAANLHPKVVAGSASGAAVTLIIYAGTLVHVTIPDAVAAAAVVVVSAVAGYFAPAHK